MNIRQTVLLEVDQFATDTGLAETSIGSLALKDSRFVARLRDGRGVSLKNIEKLKAFLESERVRRGIPITRLTQPAPAEVTP